MAKNTAIVLVSYGSVNNLPKLTGLKQQKCIALQFRQLQVQSRGLASGHAHSEGARGESLPLPALSGSWRWLACRCVPQSLPFTAHCVPPVSFSLLWVSVQIPLFL